MKHNSLISANGFHTPIASTTVKSSFLTTIFKPLLLLFLLVLGSSAAWADTYFKPGETIYLRVSGDCKNWYNFGGWAVIFYYAGNDNIAYGQNAYHERLWNGTGDLSSYLIRQETYSPSVSSGKSAYRITNIGAESNNERILSFTVPTDGTTCIDRFRICRLEQDVNNGYVNGAQHVVSASGAGTDKNRVYFSAWQDGDGAWETGTGATITTTTCSGGGGGDPEPAEREISTDYRLRGDLWVYDDNGNWAGRNNNPELTLKSYRETDGTYTFSYIAPVAPKNRFTVMIGGGSDITASKADGSSSDVTEDGVKYKFNVSTPKQVDITYYPSTTKAKVVLSDYTPITSGWYFKCESAIGGISANTNTAMAADGTLLLENVAEGTYNFYIHNNASELYWGQNKFGGCYVDQTNSTASLISSKITDAKFDSKQWPIKRVSDRKVKMVVSGSDAGKNVRVSFDGGKIVLTLQDPPTPAVTYTVTIHPNGGTAVSPLSVGEGQTISSISSTYGNGTAKWYKDEELTQEFILGTSTVTGNMDLYAKWGVSDNFYIVGDLHMYDNAGNWDNNKGWQLTYPSGSSTCAVSYIAPTGVNRFEIIKDREWNQKIKINNSYTGVLNNTLSDVTLSEVDGHMQFTISESTPQKVTVHYDGKVWVTHEAYTPKYTGWRMTADGWDGQTAWSHSTLLDNTGKAIIRNVSAGQHQFKITDGDDGNVGIEEFNALYVDITNPSQGLTWASATTNYGKTNVPQSDNQYRNCTFTLENNASYMVNGKYDLQVTFDGGKIRCDILPKYTVSFNSNGGSEVASQSVFEGATASEPSAPTKAGCNFQGWQLSGADYSFSSAVTGNITLDAVWANKPIESVALSENSHTTWIGNSDFVLTLTKNPSDLITKTIVWSSDAEGVASVSNGTVHAAGVGTATITCTVTDMFDHVRTATCDVTVAPCEMTTDALYSMTVTGCDTYSGSSATLNGLWNESSDNDGPEYPIVKLKLFNNYYVYDDNGTVKMSTDASLAAAQWYEIPTNENFSPDWTGSSFALYEFKNVSTGKYLRRGAGRYGDNGDWYYYTTLADNRETDGNIYKFFYDNTLNTHLVCREGVNSTLRQSYAIHNNNLNWAAGYSAHCAAPMVVCGYTNDPNDNAYTWLHARVLVSAAAANFIHSQMNSSYYRMKADATVRANLANGLAYGSVITVRLYADAATSVKLQTAAGADVETIELNADAAREYTYTVAYGSELVGETAFVIKAADNHAGIASIEVSRMHAVSPSSPALTWEADLSGGVTQSALASTFQHVASSALSYGAVHYVSSNPAVATVAADGTVTPIMAGNATITATIEQRECYDEASITYNVTLTEPTLAELIAADAGAGITLTHDYAEDIVIDKAITINGDGHTIGDLKIENTGDLTLSSGLTVRDFTICAKAGNTSIQAASGQVRNANNLTVNGNAYFLYTVDPSGHVQYGWYDFTVPFPVNVMTGIAGIQDNDLNEDFVNERDYAIMEYLGERKAQGQYPYQKFRGVMQPNQLYSITLDSRDNYNTVRFQKTADGELVADDDVTLHEYLGDGIHDNLNGVGNGTLHHADAGISGDYVQVYQSGEKTFLTVEKTQYSFVVGTAFMVQEKGTMTLSQATPEHNLLAPARQASAPATAIQIAREGQPFSDQLFISASETGGQAYTPGTDLAKAGDLGSANVPQIWTNAYNNPLCVHEAQLVNGEASYNLSIYAPAADTYTLTSQNIPADYSLYLTQNGTMLTELSGTYTLDLNKGITTEYGLLLVETYKTPTGMEEPMSQESRVKSQKILRGGVLYILHNGKVYNAQGGKVCDL